MRELTDDQLTLTIRAVHKAMIDAESSDKKEKARILRNALKKLEND